MENIDTVQGLWCSNGHARRCKLLSVTNIPSPCALTFFLFCLTPPFFLFSSAIFSLVISSWYSLRRASFGSSLMWGLFLMFLARLAYLQCACKHGHQKKKDQEGHSITNNGMVVCFVSYNRHCKHSLRSQTPYVYDWIDAHNYMYIAFVVKGESVFRTSLNVLQLSIITRHFGPWSIISC